MIYSITHDHENAIITLQLKGAMELNGFIRMLDEVGVKILQTQCYDLLVDVTNLSVRLALLDLNTLPGLMQATLEITGSIQLHYGGQWCCHAAAM